jgi:hypothetical protein
MAGRAIAAVGVVLAFVGIWVDALPGESYWSLDGTIGAFALVLACLAALLFAGGYVSQWANGPLFAVGAVMLGYYGEYPAVLAFDNWDETKAGMWLAFGAGALIVIGAGASYVTGGAPRDTPAGLSREVLAAGLGIALVFPGIFLDTVRGASYWTFSVFGHSLGIVMLVLAIAAGLVWAAGVAGTGTRGLDQGLTLVLLGLVAFLPVGAAFKDFGSLRSGAWIALAGGILAAGGTWAARGTEAPRAAAAAA